MSEEDGRCLTCQGSAVCAACRTDMFVTLVVDLTCDCLGTRQCVDCAGQGTYSQYAAVQMWRLKQVMKRNGLPTGD